MHGYVKSFEVTLDGEHIMMVQYQAGTLVFEER